MAASASAELQELLSRVALHDRAAFRRLYDATAPYLLGVALRIVKHKWIVIHSADSQIRRQA